MSRAEFFRAAARVGLFAGLTGTAAFLMVRAAREARCAGQTACASCPEFAGCDLGQERTGRTR